MDTGVTPTHSTVDPEKCGGLRFIPQSRHRVPKHGRAAPLGPMARWDFDPMSSPQPTHRVPTCPRGPVGANGTMGFRSRVLAPTGHRIPTCQRGSVAANRHLVSVTMPQRGIAYQPRVQTLGIPGKTNPRSEGTPHSREPRTSTPAHALCGVPSEHTDSVGCGVPRAMPWAGMRCPFRA